jgi:hypothetical protein
VQGILEEGGSREASLEDLQGEGALLLASSLEVEEELAFQVYIRAMSTLKRKIGQ